MKRRFAVACGFLKASAAAPLLAALLLGLGVSGTGCTAAPPPARTVVNTAPKDVGPPNLWRFETADGRSDGGRLPENTSRILRAPSFDGTGLLVTNTAPVPRYPNRSSPTGPLFNGEQGTVRLAYQPLWSTHLGGPGHWARLFEVGSFTREASDGWFALSISPDGTEVWWAAQDGRGITRSNRLAQMSFSQGRWTTLTFTYAPGVLTFCPGGAFFRVKPDPLPELAARLRERPLAIGGDTQGQFPCDGVIDEFEIRPDVAGFGEIRFGLLSTFAAEAGFDPPAVNLRWRASPSIPCILSRRVPPSSAWLPLVTNSAWSHLDINVARGGLYQYRLHQTNFSLGIVSQTRYVYAAVGLPPREDRGRILVLVDETLARSLKNELGELAGDLAGDGWEVVLHPAPRHDDQVWSNNPPRIAHVRSLIAGEHARDPERTRTVYLLGHVAIPYSGFTAEDFHRERGLNHFGAWPADCHYGDVDGLWTDRQAYPTNLPPVRYPDTLNQAGDGKFDQNAVPTNSLGVARLELAVGRVDFAKLPALAKASPPRSELGLLRDYLAKTRAYRRGELRFLPQVSALSRLGSPSSPENTVVYHNARRLASVSFNSGHHTQLETDCFADRVPALWGVQGGFGDVFAINNALPYAFYTRNLGDPDRTPAAAFYLLRGSFFGDWNLSQDNLLRALLSIPRGGLAATFTKGSVVWRWEALGIGGTLGDALLDTAEHYGGERALYILGDPTLRIHITPPVANLVGRKTEATRLGWSHTGLSQPQFHVYRAPSSAGPFTNRLTSLPLSQPRFIDPTPPTGRVAYAVRALETVRTGCGTYTNLSQATVIELN